MSSAPSSIRFSDRLAGRWQIPLLLLSIAVLLTGIFRLRPDPKAVPFDELYANAVSLKASGFYVEASEYALGLVAAPERTPVEKRRLHRLLAEIIHAHEAGNVVHGESNARAILTHSDASLVEADSHDVTMHLMRAEAWEWLDQPVHAIAEYRQAAARGLPDPWPIRKRIIELQRATARMTPDDLHQAYDAFLGGEGVPEALRYWAAEKKVELYGEHGQHEEARQFLAAHAEAFQATAYAADYDYLTALSWYHLGRGDDAERRLRSLREGAAPGHPLYARTGWLLGKVLQDQESPEFALAFFEDVLNETTPAPYWTASMLGRAEVLAGLERFEDSVKAYEEVIRLATEQPYDAGVDLAVVRESTRALYQTLLSAGRLEGAMSYLRIAARLAPPSDERAQVWYTQGLADLAYALGEATRLRAALSPEDADAGQEAVRHFVEAGEGYLKLARRVQAEGPRSSEAAWRAADAFDQAAERRRAAGVLEAFLRARADSPRAPMALLRLGQTYQALGDHAAAIGWYQQNLVSFPRTPAAVSSLVPLADCFIATGQPDKAEQTLLRIVDRPLDDPLSVITPAADEYREALFRLGDLYLRSDAFEKAIARYEEARERYPDDERFGRATFLLAESCRRSAARIREDLNDTKNIAYVDHLKRTHEARLLRARKLYDRVIESYPDPPAAADAYDLEAMYVKLSHFYRADVVYDLAQTSDPSDLRPYVEAWELYDRAAWLYQGDPIAMSAYVQMINCHLRLGNAGRARMALQRAKWALRGMEDERFGGPPAAEDRKFWADYFAWLEQMPTLAGGAGEGSS